MRLDCVIDVIDKNLAESDCADISKLLGEATFPDAKVICTETAIETSNAVLVIQLPEKDSYITNPTL